MTPHAIGSEMMLDIPQIIPVPEATEYVIGISKKETEQSFSQDTQKKRHTLRMAFWQFALARLRMDGIALFDNVSATRDHWLSAEAGIFGCQYRMVFSRDEVRVELALQRQEFLDNKRIFDRMQSRKDEIEKRFGAPLEWRVSDDRRSARIFFRQAFDGFDETQWEEISSWFSRHLVALESACAGPIADVKQMLESQADTIS